MRDDRGVTCRRWNWRHGRRTQLTESTRSAFFVIDRLDGLCLNALHDAVDDFSGRLRDRSPDCKLERPAAQLGSTD